MLIIFLYLFRLGADGFYNRDEERFALAAQEMLQTGNWLIPTIRGNPLATKPILFYWLILIPSSLMGGVSEWTTKLPSALAGLAGLALTFLWGRALWGRRAGLLAALILATSYGYLWQAQMAQVDMVLTLFVLLALSGGMSLWIWMLPAGLLSAFVGVEKEEREKSLFLLIWVIFVLVFFSAVPFKRDHYLTPLYPAAALLIARAWNLAIGRVSSAQALAWMRWSLGLILLVTLLGAPAYTGYIAFRFPERMNPFFTASLIFLTAAPWAAFVLFRRQKPAWSFGLLSFHASLFLFLLICNAVPYPNKEEPQPSKVLAQRLLSTIQPGEVVITYQFWKPGLDFYLHRSIPQT